MKKNLSAYLFTVFFLVFISSGCITGVNDSSCMNLPLFNSSEYDCSQKTVLTSKSGLLEILETEVPNLSDLTISRPKHSVCVKKNNSNKTEVVQIQFKIPAEARTQFEELYNNRKENSLQHYFYKKPALFLLIDDTIYIIFNHRGTDGQNELNVILESCLETFSELDYFYIESN